MSLKDQVKPERRYSAAIVELAKRDMKPTAVTALTHGLDRRRVSRVMKSEGFEVKGGRQFESTRTKLRRKEFGYAASIAVSVMQQLRIRENGLDAYSLLLIVQTLEALMGDLPQESMVDFTSFVYMLALEYRSGYIVVKGCNDCYFRVIDHKMEKIACPCCRQVKNPRSNRNAGAPAISDRHVPQQDLPFPLQIDFGRNRSVAA